MIRAGAEMTRSGLPLVGGRLLSGVGVALFLLAAWAGLSRVPGLWVFAGIAIVTAVFTVGWVVFRVREDLRTAEGRAQILGTLWKAPQVATFVIVWSSLEEAVPETFLRCCLSMLASAPVVIAAGWLRGRLGHAPQVEAQEPGDADHHAMAPRDWLELAVGVALLVAAGDLALRFGMSVGLATTVAVLVFMAYLFARGRSRKHRPGSRREGDRPGRDGR